MHFKTGGSSAQAFTTVNSHERATGFVLKDTNFGDKYVTSVYR